MLDKNSEQPVLIVESHGPVRVITMNRPDKLNALNTALTRSLLEALLSAETEPEIRAIVLAGSGRGFCAGADLAEFKDLVPERQHLVLERADLTCRLQAQLHRSSKPVVSAVQGAAIGGGAGLAIGCDMMVTGSDLKFGYPELKHDLVPALVMTSLQRQLGRKAAFEMISLGRLIGAEEARALGLVNRIVEPAAVLDAALEIANAWSDANPMAMAAAKNLFYRIADLPFDAAMAAGRDVNALMRGFRKAGR